MASQHATTKSPGRHTPLLVTPKASRANSEDPLLDPIVAALAFCVCRQRVTRSGAMYACGRMRPVCTYAIVILTGRVHGAGSKQLVEP